MTQPTDLAAHRWYRTDRSWGITIVEQTRPDADDPACQSRLVALALDRDTADRIVALLNADEAGERDQTDIGYARYALVTDARRALRAAAGAPDHRDPLGRALYAAADALGALWDHIPPPPIPAVLVATGPVARWAGPDDDTGASR